MLSATGTRKIIIDKSSDYTNKIQWDAYLTLESSTEVMYFILALKLYS